MFEFLFCSMVTILPDYLYRHFKQGKRWGRELTLFTMWFELRWGITSCFMLTVSLITVIFYYHPSTTHVASNFRTVTILSEGGGRVEEIFVENGQHVNSGVPLFRLDGASQKAAAVTARTRIVEVDAAALVAGADLEAAEANVRHAEAAFAQTQDELERKQTLFDRNSSAVSARDVETLQNRLAEREADIEAAVANKEAVHNRIEVLLPAQKDSAEAALDQAETELAKMTVYAGVDGTIEQFTLRVGDYVNPILRPAGILVPSDAGRNRFQAGFGQISSQVLHPGMLAEMTCMSAPMTIIPMVITEIQDVIAAGQMRPSDRLIDFQNSGPPGTLTVFMEPLYAGQTSHLPPGSNCIANAYTNNHEKLADPELGFGSRIALHTIDTVGLAHAMILRIQSLLLPIQTLVLTGH